MTTDWEWQRAEILQWVGPGKFIVVVHKDLRDAVLEQFNLQPEDVPGLIVSLLGEIGHWDGMIIRRMTFPPLLLHPPPRPLQKPLPYPPRLKGRYAR